MIHGTGWRQWLIEDDVGRRWRLIASNGTPAQPSLRRHELLGIIDSLVFDAFSQDGIHEGHAHTLVEIYEELRGGRCREWHAWRLSRTGSLRRIAEEIRDELEHATTSSFLSVERADVLRRSQFAELPNEPNPPSPEPAPPLWAPASNEQEATTWIEIALLDEQGQPVENARCLLTSPDGMTREFLTGPDGRVYGRGLAPGGYSIAFPDFDATEWTPS